MTLSRSNDAAPPQTRYRAVALAAIAVLVASGIGGFGALVTTDRHIVTEDDVLDEDQYVTAVSSTVEGTIDGDLTIFAGSITISGTVTGNLNAFSSGTVTITDTGSIGGSVNGAATALSMQGDIAGDVFFTAGSIVLEPGSDVGRDVIAFGGSTRIEGTVGRDVRGRAVRMSVDGRVRGDVDVATTILTIGPTARIGGDVLYRSSSDADIAQDAVIVGTTTRLPAQSNFIYGIILTLANIVGFLGFVVAGLVALWLLRGVGSRATGAILTKPIRTFFAGLGIVIVFPVIVALIAVTLVGIPIAIVLAALAVVMFIIGAVPAVTALGNLVLLRRGGLFGAFLVGAVLWRLGIWLIPVVGGALFVIGLVWGIGGWALGALAARRGDPTPAALMPANLVAAAEATPDWEPPRSPTAIPVPDIDDGSDEEDEVVEPSSAPEDSEVPPVDPEAERDLTFAAAPVTFDGSEDDPAAPTADHDAAPTEVGASSPPPVTHDRQPVADDEGAPDDLDSDPEPTRPVVDESTSVPDADPTPVDPTPVDPTPAEPTPAPPASGPSAPEESASEDQTLEDRLAAFRTELEENPDEPAVDDETARRFRALREELQQSGTVEPPAPRPDPFDDRGGDDDSDWGLPKR